MFESVVIRVPSLMAVVLGLSLVVACGESSEGEDGGGPVGQLSQEFGSISQLADSLVMENAGTYQGLEFAAQALQIAIAPPAASLAVVPKQEGSCIPVNLQDTTLAYDPSSGTYTSSDIPGAPAGGVSVLLYEISNGVPTTTEMGSLNVTCSGFLPNPSLVATLTTDEDVDILELNATNVSLSLDSYSMTVSGFLADSSGEQTINFGDLGGSNGSMSSFESFFSVDFTVGEGTYAILNRRQYPDIGENTVFLNVFREGPGLPGQEFLRSFDFNANLFGTGEVLQGPASFEFWQNPVNLTGYFLGFVACFEGTFEAMDVLVASECFPPTDITDLELVTLSPQDRAAIKAAYNGLRGMYAAVEGISTAAAAIGQTALAEMN